MRIEGALTSATSLARDIATGRIKENGVDSAQCQGQGVRIGDVGFDDGEPVRYPNSCGVGSRDRSHRGIAFNCGNRNARKGKGDRIKTDPATKIGYRFDAGIAISPGPKLSHHQTRCLLKSVTGVEQLTGMWAEAAGCLTSQLHLGESCSGEATVKIAEVLCDGVCELQSVYSRRIAT